MAAAKLANADPTDSDQDWSLPIEAIDQAKLGTHSLRRLADKRMRAFCIANNIPLSKVDAKLGWKQTEHRLSMQEHYDEEDLRSRMKDARATAYYGEGVLPQ